MKRRDFLTTVAAAGVGAAAGIGSREADARDDTRLPCRPLGETARSLSIIGLGGLVVSQISQQEANDMVAWAWERGVTYYDVAPTYGNAEERLGPALEPYRDKAFLACKTVQRKADGARAELEQSLTRLRTDHVDLYQFHGLTKPEDVDTVMGKGGALEAFLQAREEGKIRYIGFSAHSVEAALVAMDRFDFDTILFPFNVVCVENGNFGPQVLERAQEKGVHCLALKAMAWTKLGKGQEKKYPKAWYEPVDDANLAGLALRYTLGLPVVAAVPPADGRLFKMAVEYALEYKPLTEDERAELVAAAQGVEPIFECTV